MQVIISYFVCKNKWNKYVFLQLLDFSDLLMYYASRTGCSCVGNHSPVGGHDRGRVMDLSNLGWSAVNILNKSLNSYQLL